MYQPTLRKVSCILYNRAHYGIYHFPPGFLSLRKKEPLPVLSPQTPVLAILGHAGPRLRISCLSSCCRSSLPSCPFSWCPVCHYFCPSVVFETCNVSRPSMYSLLDNVYHIIYTCLMLYPGIAFVIAYSDALPFILRCATDSSST